MTTVSKRELNQHTASVLDQATGTEQVIVTERGQPRWTVSAYRPQDSALVRMEREGRYAPPAVRPAPWQQVSEGEKYTDAEVDALLDETREDR